MDLNNFKASLWDELVHFVDLTNYKASSWDELIYFVGLIMNLSTCGLSHESSFVEINIYTGHIRITHLIMINACISKKLFLKRIKT